jgi:hypothetical protein
LYCYNTAQLKLVDELGIAQMHAAAATQTHDSLARALAEAEAREEAANAKLRALKDMGIPIDALLAQPCGCPVGVVQVKSS